MDEAEVGHQLVEVNPQEVAREVVLSREEECKHAVNAAAPAHQEHPTLQATWVAVVVQAVAHLRRKTRPFGCILCSS